MSECGLHTVYIYILLPRLILTDTSLKLLTFFVCTKTRKKVGNDTKKNLKANNFIHDNSIAF